MTASEKKTWKSDSIDGALLFLLFQYRVFDCDSYSAAEIYRHPSLPFGSYSKKNFSTYCQTAANKAKKFRKNGTGLTAVFKEFVTEAKQKYSDLLQKLREEDEEEKDDESYQGEEEEDIPLEADDDVSLSELLRHKDLEEPEAHPKQSMPTAKTKKAATASTSTTTAPASAAKAAKQGTLPTVEDPYVLPYPKNDRLYVQFGMDGNVDIDEDFKVDLKSNAIEVWGRVPVQLESASDLLGSELRLSKNPENCIHCSSKKGFLG